MPLNKKNISTTIMVFGLIIPFIFITDLFPFVRFGMFAEPIKTTNQTESFVLFYQTNEKKYQLFDPHVLGSNENSFLYLCRNYYYRNEMEKFARTILYNPKNDSIRALSVYRIINIGNNTDTLLIGSYSKK